MSYVLDRDGALCDGEAEQEIVPACMRGGFSGSGGFSFRGIFQFAWILADGVLGI